MSTIINNPTPNEHTVIESDSSSGWAVAVIILVAVIAGGAYLWMSFDVSGAPAQPQSGATINVTLPTSESNSPTPTK